MAKRTGNKTKDTIKVKALIYLKYDTECYEPGDEFKARKQDIENMVKNKYVEALEEIPEEEVNVEEEVEEEAAKEGE